MSCQMMRVISSPSSSTTVFATLILDMVFPGSLHRRARHSPVGAAPTRRRRTAWPDWLPRGLFFPWPQAAFGLFDAIGDRRGVRGCDHCSRGSWKARETHELLSEHAKDDKPPWILLFNPLSYSAGIIVVANWHLPDPIFRRKDGSYRP